jgi:hypothetical protein
MKMPVHEGPEWRLLIGGLAAILLGVSGIAAVTVGLPTTTALAAVEEVAAPRGRVKCAECGIVESTRDVGPAGAALDPGTKDEVTRGGRNAKRYQVTVRMKDGTSRVFLEAHPAHWRAGERVTFIDGASNSSD